MKDLTNAPSEKPTVLVLMGGPDAEHPVSIDSGTAIADGLAHNGTYNVQRRTIDRVTHEQLAAMPGDVIFPALHGRYGEGGVLQDVLELDGRPYVGSGPTASRMCMDKLATLLIGARLGITTLPACVVDTRDVACPVGFPCVIKPVHDGSSVGLHICHDENDYQNALETMVNERRAHPDRAYMVEPYVQGLELTFGVLGDEVLPAIQITPADGVYDYDAKYTRNDTTYEIEPVLSDGLPDTLLGTLLGTLSQQSLELCKALGTRDLARVDYMIGLAGAWSGRAVLLEINTMPGFTSHSLLPKAAAHIGIDFPALVTKLAAKALARATAARTAAV